MILRLNGNPLGSETFMDAIQGRTILHMESEMIQSQARKGFALRVLCGLKEGQARITLLQEDRIATPFAREDMGKAQQLTIPLLTALYIGASEGDVV